MSDSPVAEATSFVVPRLEDGSINFAEVPDWIETHGDSKWARKTYDKNVVDGFDESNHEDFKLRSKSYLTDSVKVPSQTPMFRTCGINVFHSDKKTYHTSKYFPSQKKYIEDYKDVYSEFFVVNWQLPGPPHYNVVHMYGRIIPEGEDVAFDNAYNRFKEGDAEYRNQHLKFLPSIVQGPWAVKLAANQLGGSRPCIIGNKLTVTYNQGPNYIEVNIDVGSSRVASTLNGLIIRSASSLCVDECFIIEGKEEDCLPERLIGCSRFIHASLETIRVEVTLPEDYEEEI